MEPADGSGFAFFFSRDWRVVGLRLARRTSCGQWKYLPEEFLRFNHAVFHHLSGFWRVHVLHCSQDLFSSYRFRGLSAFPQTGALIVAQSIFLLENGIWGVLKSL